MKRTRLQRRTPLRARPATSAPRAERTRPPLAPLVRPATDSPPPLAPAAELEPRQTYADRPRDRERMDWTSRQPCAVLEWSDLWVGPPPDPCDGRIEVHHAGRHPYGNKSDDDTVVPLCHHHHQQITNIGVRGTFVGWPPGAVRAWQDGMIERYRVRYDAQRSAVL